MNNKDQVRLAHLIESCLAIQQYINGRCRTDLDTDRMLLSALTRELEIIGEAVNALSEELTSAHPEIPWKDMVGMRNRLIHAYYNINAEIVWKTATVAVPELQKSISLILRAI